MVEVVSDGMFWRQQALRLPACGAAPSVELEVCVCVCEDAPLLQERELNSSASSTGHGTGYDQVVDDGEELIPRGRGLGERMWAGFDAVREGAKVASDAVRRRFFRDAG